MSDATKPDLTGQTPDDEVTWAGWTPGGLGTAQAAGYPTGLSVLGQGPALPNTPIWCARPHIPEGYCAVPMEEYAALRETCSMQRAILRRHYPIHRNRYERRRQQVAEQSTRHKLAVFKRKGFDILSQMSMTGEWKPCQGVVQ